MLEEERLKLEYAWLEYCIPLFDGKLVVLPKLAHGQLTILVMDFIGGTTGDHNVGRICEAFLALHRAIKPKTDELCPSGSWYLKGHIFKPCGDGGLDVRSSILSWMTAS